MALKSTIHKAAVDILDVDRGVYVRRALAPARGLSDVNKPDLRQRELTGRIVQWIEVAERQIRCGIGKGKMPLRRD